MKILFFAWLREKAGTASITVTPPGSVATVSGLVDWLGSENENYADALSDLGVVRVAVNQEYVTLDHRVSAGDEIAFFPPVTGG